MSGQICRGFDAKIPVALVQVKVLPPSTSQEVRYAYSNLDPKIVVQIPAPLPCDYRCKFCLWQKGRESYQFSWPASPTHLLVRRGKRPGLLPGVLGEAWRSGLDWTGQGGEERMITTW